MFVNVGYSTRQNSMPASERVSEFASEVGVNWSIETTWFRLCNLAVSRRDVLSGMLAEHVA